MDCRSRQESLLSLALGTLQSPEREALRAHLEAGCPICEGQLRQTQLLLALLPMGLAWTAAPASARQRLMERIGAAPSQSSEMAPTLAPANPAARSSDGAVGRSAYWIGGLAGLAGAALAACVAVVIFLGLSSAHHATVAKMNQLKEQLDSRTAELEQMKVKTAEADELKHMVALPTVKMVHLVGTTAQPRGAGALVMWDSTSGTLRLVAADLKPLPQGMAYELWVIPQGGKPLPAGTFTVDETGMASIKSSLQLDPATVVQGAVTDEPSNEGKGTQAPTGKFQLQSRI